MTNYSVIIFKSIYSFTPVKTHHLVLTMLVFIHSRVAVKQDGVFWRNYGHEVDISKIFVLLCNCIYIYIYIYRVSKLFLS